MTSQSRRLNWPVLVPALLFALLLAVPFFSYATNEVFYVALFGRIVIYAIAATALNLALGYGGMVSLGHALFLGLGAYSVAIPAFYGVDNGWLHLAICIGTCAAVGYLTGMISLRTSGIGFIMITLAFAQMGYFLFVSLKQYGGDDGTSILGTSKFFGVDLGGVYTVYVVSLIVLALATWWMARLRVAPFGMTLRGAKLNLRRVNAVGLPARRYQLLAYVLSAVLCGIAGLLLANLNAFASPSNLSWVVSGDLIVMLVLGGIGSVAGPVLGAFTFLGLEEILKMFTEYWMAIFGPIIVLVGLLGTAGIHGFLVSLEKRRKSPPPPPAASAPAPTGARP